MLADLLMTAYHPRMRVLVPAMAMLLIGSCTEPNPFRGICGNGVEEPDFDEECDLGAENGDSAGCSDECQIEACGDGVTQNATEECDLGDGNGSGAICTPDCKLARCGDGFRQDDEEECDLGDVVNKAYDGLPGCSTECKILPECGDGIIEAPYENCDDGNYKDGDGCNHLCQKAVCGDGVLDEGEKCDDGDKSDNNACLNDCTIATCGDGYVHEGVEECDDGNKDNNDACLTACIAAKCGDGLLQEGVEECDDGNEIPDDGCDNACVRDRLVFITDDYIGPKFITDLPGADIECHQAALAYGHPNPTNFKAWLSNSVNSPSTRFFKSPGRYVLSTGQVVAANWDDLTDGTLQSGIDRTLDGTLLYEQPVWSATQPNGEAWGDDLHCMAWTSSKLELEGRVGVSGFTDAVWTETGTPLSCGLSALLYCFEQN